jgi:hypothetical protein
MFEKMGAECAFLGHENIARQVRNGERRASQHAAFSDMCADNELDAGASRGLHERHGTQYPAHLRDAQVHDPALRIVAQRIEMPQA